jgi:transcriptional regulator with XRE-family HTH domain
MNSADRKLYPEMGRRLRLLRYVFGKNGPQSAFAARLKIGATAYNNYEQGYSIRHPVMKRILKEVPGIDEAWLYSGSVRGLSVEMAQRLADAESALGAEESSTLAG